MKSSPSWKIFLSNEESIEDNQKLEFLKKWLSDPLNPDMEKLFLSAFAQKIAFANIGISLDVNAEPVIIVDTGDSEKTQQVLQIIEQILKSYTGYEIQPNAGVYAEVPFGMAKNKETENSFRYAMMDNLFVLTPDQDSFETLVDVYTGKEPPILYDPKFNRTRSEFPDDSEFFAYINMELYWFTDTQTPVEGTLLKMLGVHEIKSIAWNIDLLKPNGDQDIYIYIGEGAGLLASIPTDPPEQMISPHIIPASNADIFFTMNLGDPVAVWETINNSLGGLADKGTSEFEEDTGLNMKNDVLSSLTGEIGFSMPLSRATKFLDDTRSILEDGYLIFFQAKDPERLNIVMEKILASGDAKPQQMKYKGITLYSIPTKSDSEVPVGYMFADDLLIFGNFQVFGNIIDGELPLAASENFASLVAKLPQNARIMYYIDMNNLKDILSILPSGEDLNLANLAVSGQIGGAITSDGEGLRIKSINDSGVGWLEKIGHLAILWALREY